MAYRGYNVVAWVPFGRKITVEILINHLYRNKGLVDEVWLCMNTDPEQTEDRAYAKAIADGTFIKQIEYKGKSLQPKQLNTGKFYVHMTDPNTIYVRIDDDMVYLHDNFFENLLDFRIDHPEYFLVMGQAWNNSTISYLQQNVYKNIGTENGTVTSEFAMDPVGWMNPLFAEYIHNILLSHIENGTVDKLFFDKYEINKQRFSVSNFCHFGKDFAPFKGDLKGAEEEFWLTETYPTEKNLLNCVAGNALIAHWAFFAQRPHLQNNTDLLDRYKKISQDMLSRDYYKLLGQA